MPYNQQRTGRTLRLQPHWLSPRHHWSTNGQKRLKDLASLKPSKSWFGMVKIVVILMLFWKRTTNQGSQSLSRLLSPRTVHWSPSTPKRKSLAHPCIMVHCSCLSIIFHELIENHIVEWLRVVLDEAHSCKSRTSKTAKAVYALRARRRWAVTGGLFRTFCFDSIANSLLKEHLSWIN